MSKSKEKLEARLLRKSGESIKIIASKLNVSKTIVSIWCNDILLTDDQIKKLEERRRYKTCYTSRIKGALANKDKRKKEVVILNKIGNLMSDNFNKRDLTFFGAGIYWGEGIKKSKTGVTNSNPEVIKTAMKWFTEIWGINRGDFTARIHINMIHNKRLAIVEEYWIKELNISKEQFTKTTFIKTTNKKKYENFNNHYGTLTLTIKRGGNLLHKINGLIGGIKGRI